MSDAQITVDAKTDTFTAMREYLANCPDDVGPGVHASVLAGEVVGPIISAAIADAWDEGARSHQCRCFAASEGECACGMWPSDPNPYRKETA